MSTPYPFEDTGRRLEAVLGSTDPDDYDSVERKLDDWLARNPADAHLSAIYCHLCMERGKVEQGRAAVKRLRYALDKSSFDALSWEQCASLLHVVGLYADSVDTAEDAIEMDPGDRRRAGLHLVAAVVYSMALGNARPARRIPGLMFEDLARDDPELSGVFGYEPGETEMADIFLTAKCTLEDLDCTWRDARAACRHHYKMALRHAGRLPPDSAAKVRQAAQLALRYTLPGLDRRRPCAAEGCRYWVPLTRDTDSPYCWQCRPRAHD